MGKKKVIAVVCESKYDYAIWLKHENTIASGITKTTHPHIQTYTDAEKHKPFKHVLILGDENKIHADQYLNGLRNYCWKLKDDAN